MIIEIQNILGAKIMGITKRLKMLKIIKVVTKNPLKKSDELPWAGAHFHRQKGPGRERSHRNSSLEKREGN
jgi:hypothetical protein